MTDLHDYSKTLSLPQTDFAMRANAGVREPEILASWQYQYESQRQTSQGRKVFVLHDGPPYANGNIHIGHALNKIIKDIIVRWKQNNGFDARFVPGWDCHGLPIEWAVEKQFKEQGLDKSAVPVNKFRQECRSFARKWVGVQREQFRRLGVRADWDQAYQTMSFENEAIIAERFLHFVQCGLVYRGSRPVLWSSVEETALAEAEVEYKTVSTDTVYFAFKLKNGQGVMRNARIPVYTTTPWTIPANRAIAYSPTVSYGLYRATSKAEGSLVCNGTLFVVADNLVKDVMGQIRVSVYERVQDVGADLLSGLIAQHPFRNNLFDVPLLAGDHVNDRLGTGFVHTAPSHGLDDYNLWRAHEGLLKQRGIDHRVPTLVGPNGAYTAEAGDLAGHFVYEPSGKPGKANQVVVGMLLYEDALLAGIRLHNHSYPHSWRSGTPLIYRNTAQWFVAMDKLGGRLENTLRSRALRSLDDVRWEPAGSRRRIESMLTDRPDWLVSRQRAWGVPLSVFADPEGNLLVDHAVNARILAAYREEGADAWFADGARERFLAERSGEPWQAVNDVLDVWFDSGCSQLFVGPPRGQRSETVVVEGSDQHRGWFQSSLLATMGRPAPYNVVLTHGFVLDGEKEKMSKKLGNVMLPDTVIKQSGADVLRLWVAASDYQNDVSLSRETLKTFTENYRKLRNTLRWMLGVLAHFDTYVSEDRPLIEQNMQDRALRTNRGIRAAYDAFDFKTVVALLNSFVSVDLSAYYFDVRKDAIYCDAPSSSRRASALSMVLDLLASVVDWIDPILPFLAQDVVDHVPEKARVAFDQARSIRPDQVSDTAQLFAKAAPVRERVLAALEVAREQKLIGSPLEASVQIRVGLDDSAITALDWAEFCVVSQAQVVVDGDQRVAEIHVGRAEGRKCARSWKYSLDVGADQDYPDVTPRDAAALREIEESMHGSQ